VQDISEKCRDNVRRAISKVLSDLRERIISELAQDEEQRKNNPQVASSTVSMKKKKNNTVFESLGFPDDMTYGHRSTLRKECSRFLRFAYLIDFLALESLSNIYISSVNEMIQRLNDLDS
jgi:dynein heavy chain